MTDLLASRPSSVEPPHPFEPDESKHSAQILGNHACLIYEEVSEALPVAVPYLVAGLRDGDRCLVITGEQPPQLFFAALEQAGVDIEAELGRGALAVMPIWDESLSAATFHPEGTIELVRSVVEEAQHAGFQRLRLVADMTWALQRQIGREQLIAYEALGTHLLEVAPMLALCLYHRRRSEPALIRDALRTHPQVILESQLYPNFYYEPPELIREDPTSPRVAERVNWMIDQLRSAGEEERSRSRLLSEQAARAGVEAVLQRQIQFVSNISHDLKSPLASVRGLAQLLLREERQQQPPNPDHLSKVLTQIEEATTTMQALLDELVDAVYLRAGQELQLRREPTDLVALVQRRLEGRRDLTPQHSIELQVTEPEGSLTGEWDGGRLDRVVENLLSNAIKYSPNGGRIAVRIGSEPRGSAWAVLVISDQGIGIPKSDLPHLFEYFHRGGNVRGHIDGAGLGLAGVKQIVEQHGGSITFDSTEGTGTTLTLRLPRMAPGKGH